MVAYARSVIVIDDEQLVASCISGVLQDFGFTVCGSVSCALDALWLAERYRPDIAIVDIRLNGKMDGIDIGQILSEHFNIAIVFLSGSYDNAVAIRSEALGSAMFLQKPFRPTRLLGAIEAALEASKSNDGAAVASICEPVPRTQVNTHIGTLDIDRGMDLAAFHFLAGHHVSETGHSLIVSRRFGAPSIMRHDYPN